MKVLKVIGIIVGILLIAFLALSLTSSPEGSLESSIIIEAPPAAVYEECVNIKKMDAWSPWYNLDPASFSYEGPEEGVGAKSNWDSEHQELGQGSVTIVEAEENRLIRTKMAFGDFAGDFGSWVKLEPVDEGTKVIWGYDYSNLDLVGRFFMSIMDINEEMMPKFDEGLADLKATVEAKPVEQPDALTTPVEQDSIPADSIN